MGSVPVAANEKEYAVVWVPGFIGDVLLITGAADPPMLPFQISASLPVVGVAHAYRLPVAGSTVIVSV
jgi:hypothetical protein